MADTREIVPLDEVHDADARKGKPDPRGWEVVAADGTKVGEVDELLVDRTSHRLRYLDVELNDRLLVRDDGREERHVLIPVGYARLAPDLEKVMVTNLRTEDVAQLPPLGAGPVTREYELELRDRLDEKWGVEPVLTEGFYTHDMYSDRDFYGD